MRGKAQLLRVLIPCYYVTIKLLCTWLCLKLTWVFLLNARFGFLRRSKERQARSNISIRVTQATFLLKRISHCL